MSLAMDRAKREAFLAGIHVGVLSVAGDEGHAPLAVPVWYTYPPGGRVSVITGRNSRKARLIRKAGRFTICAQNEGIPYMYVTAEGRVATIEDHVTEDERRATAERYLGAEGVARYLESTAEMAAEEIVMRMQPERWLSADFTSEFS